MSIAQATNSITRRYHFEAAHFLPKVREGHKCARVHGHNYEVEITATGPIDQVGFIVDFWDLDKLVHPLIELVDHRTLNDIAGLDNPTAEYIALWFLSRLNSDLRGWKVVGVRVFETKDCWADARFTG